jgi:hypothetical protein
MRDRGDARSSPGARDPGIAGGVLSRLSEAALRHGQALALDDPARLAARLYFYHRQPLTPEWRRRLPSPSAVAEYLDLGDQGGQTPGLARTWRRVPPSRSQGWVTWTSSAASPSGRRRTRYKLYVSPRAEHLREAFRAVVDLLPESDARVVKVGHDVWGLLRADKLILYFPTLDGVVDAARRLGRSLAGLPAHGVPFTAELAGQGLLSWGMDPPRTAAGRGPEPESWRTWVTGRLAAALLLARAGASPTIEPWRSALRGIERHGVDSRRWTPPRALWDPPRGAGAR